MLIRLNVTNFLSFNEKKEFNMFANNRIDKRKNQILELDNSNRVLNLSVLYGANASGKSNFIQVLSFLKHILVSGLNNTTKELYCRTNRDNEKVPTRIEMEFVSNGKIFAYGFEAILIDKTIEKEWLYEINYEKESQNLLFGRYIEDNEVVIELNPDTDISDTDKEFSSTFIAKAKVNRSESFLKIINDESKMFSEEFNEIYYSVRKWIEEKLEIIKPNTRYRTSKTDEEHLKKVASIIKEFDTGISDIKLVNIAEEKLRSVVPNELLEDIINDSEKYEKMSFTLNFNKFYYVIEIDNGEIVNVKELMFRHHNKECEFKYFEESDGTKRLFDILDMLLTTESKIFVVDELERSLHPRLTKRFIELFLNKSIGMESQLIFTTHETYIMSLELFRQDEIWFVEKNNDGYSSIYSLNEYKERYDKRIDKAYLEGRYGAVPVFRNLEMEG